MLYAPSPSKYHQIPEPHLTMSDHLALYWESLGGGGLFRQGNLSIASANKSREDLAVAVNPLRELLRKDGCGLLAIVEALDEGR